MSIAVERPSGHTSPAFEKTFEEICNEWLQFDVSQPPSPQASTKNAAASQLTDNTSLWLDIEQYALPLSPRLLISDVQSPGSFRPYGTPITKEKPSEQQNDGYFSFQPNIAQEEHSVVSDNMDIPQFQPRNYDDASHEQSTIVAHQSQMKPLPYRSKAPSVPSAFDSDLVTHLPTLNTHLELEKCGRKRKFSVDDPMRIKHYRGPSDNTVGVMVEWGKPPQRRSRMDKQRKQEYRDTRKKGACDNCRRGRRRCNRSCLPYIECLTSKPLIFLDRPVDVRLFRLRPCAGHPLASEKAEIYALADLSSSPCTAINYISQGFSGLSLQVRLCEFEAHPDLKTARVYKTSRGRIGLEIPRLCLSNIEAATKSLGAYIESSWCRYLQAILLASDPITQEVLREAQRYTINRPRSSACLVRRALMLLAVNRMIEISWTFVGQEIPGLAIVEDPESPWFGQRPITPVMDTQLDQIIIQTFLTPLRTRMLEELQAKMIEGRRKDQFEIFLTTFILQTNTALLLRHSRLNAIKCGAGRRYNSIALAQEYFHGSNILLAHFHHGCGGIAGVLRNASGRTTLGVEHEQQVFLNRLISNVHAQGTSLLSLRSEKQYEADLFWTHQMFFDGWIPEDRSVAEVCDTAL